MTLQPRRRNGPAAPLMTITSDDPPGPRPAARHIVSRSRKEPAHVQHDHAPAPPVTSGPITAPPARRPAPRDVVPVLARAAFALSLAPTSTHARGTCTASAHGCGATPDGPRPAPLGSRAAPHTATVGAVPLPWLCWSYSAGPSPRSGSSPLAAAPWRRGSAAPSRRRRQRRGPRRLPPPKAGQRPIFTFRSTLTWSTSDVRTVTFMVQVPASGRLRELVPQ